MICLGKKKFSLPKFISEDPNDTTRTQRGFPRYVEGLKHGTLNNPRNDTTSNCSIWTPTSRWPDSKPSAVPIVCSCFPCWTQRGQKKQKQLGIYCWAQQRNAFVDKSQGKRWPWSRYGKSTRQFLVSDWNRHLDTELRKATRTHSLSAQGCLAVHDLNACLPSRTKEGNS